MQDENILNEIVATQHCIVEIANSLHDIRECLIALTDAIYRIQENKNQGAQQ